MAGVKYIAKTGINFDGLKGKPRVEPGETIPENVPEATIKELLADGAIEKASLSSAVKASSDSLNTLLTSLDTFQKRVTASKEKE